MSGKRLAASSRRRLLLTTALVLNRLVRNVLGHALFRADRHTIPPKNAELKALSPEDPPPLRLERSRKGAHREATAAHAEGRYGEPREERRETTCRLRVRPPGR